MGFFNLKWGNTTPVTIERDVNSNTYYELSHGNINIVTKTDAEKIRIILTNPSVLKAMAYNADIFSMGKVISGDNKDFLRSKRPKPNYTESWTQFMWEYMFWIQLGTAYLYRPNNSTILNKTNGIQWLNPALIEWTTDITNASMDLILSESKYNELQNKNIKYNLGNGEFIMIPLREITPIFDMSGNLGGNKLIGSSRLDALYQVINNNNWGLAAKEKNLEFSAKFLISGKHNPNDVATLPMSDAEKNDIERKINGGKSVHAVKTIVDIQRFVSDIANLKLDEGYLADYKIISSMFGIPSDLAEDSTMKGSTYQNITQARINHMAYWVLPKAEELMNVFMDIYGYKNLTMSYNHLPYNRVIELEDEALINAKLVNIQLAKELGVNLDTLK